MELKLAPKTKRAKGEVCCEPLVLPDVNPAQAADLAKLGKALSDPIRVQLVDVLRKNAGKVCVCELVPLFDVSQPTVSHHLRVLWRPASSSPRSRACGPTTSCCPERSTPSPAG